MRLFINYSTTLFLLLIITFALYVRHSSEGEREIRVAFFSNKVDISEDFVFSLDGREIKIASKEGMYEKMNSLFEFSTNYKFISFKDTAFVISNHFTDIYVEYYKSKSKIYFKQVHITTPNLEYCP